MQLLTYIDVSVCKFSHMKMCLFAKRDKLTITLPIPLPLPLPLGLRLGLGLGWLYLVSGTTVGNYVTNRVSCVESYACTCLYNSKSVQTCLLVREHAHKHVT